jgi:release factor glutamine methyltransferase
VRPVEVVRRGTGYLARHGVASPEVDAEQLMLAVLGTDRAGLRRRDAPLGPDEARAYGRALCRRCTGTPLQHLTGTQGFRHLVLHVAPGVFIPRPETEVLVAHALAAIADLAEPSVADACTGTGAVALSIVHEHPGARVVATDVSADAVRLARRNAASLGLDVAVRQADLLDGVDGPLDLITANPPYVPEDRRPGLPAEVVAEPDLAVFGGPAIYARLFAQAAALLRPGGHVAVEIEDAAGATVRALAVEAGLLDVAVHPDLNGRDRVVVGRGP